MFGGRVNINSYLNEEGLERVYYPPEGVHLQDSQSTHLYQVFRLMTFFRPMKIDICHLLLIYYI